MYNLIENLLGYTGTNLSSSTITNICGALIIVFQVCVLYFLFRIFSLLFYR